MTKILLVATAVTKPRFLDGSHCVEFTTCPERYVIDGDAYYIRQLAVCRLRQDPDERPIIVERHRSFGSKLTDPWPTWRAFLGSGIGPHGFYGVCPLHLESLLAPARLVALAKNDRVPPEEPGWDKYRNREKPDRLAREREAFEARR
jgi:hypothetical protein